MYLADIILVYLRVTRVYSLWIKPAVLAFLILVSFNNYRLSLPFFFKAHRHEVTICNYELAANPADHKVDNVVPQTSFIS